MTSGSIAIGGVAGVLVILAMELLEYLRIDDPVGAWTGAWRLRDLGHVVAGPIRLRPIFSVRFEPDGNSGC